MLEKELIKQDSIKFINRDGELSGEKSNEKSNESGIQSPMLSRPILLPQRKESSFIILVEKPFMD